MIQKPDLISHHPANCKEWCNVAIERGKDATMLQNQREIAAVYMAGYVIEAYLKAYYQSKGVSFPTSGQGGHDLFALWHKSGLTYGSIVDNGQAFDFFIRKWSTDLRYCTNFSFPISAPELLKGAQMLAGIIANAIKRSRKRC